MEPWNAAIASLVVTGLGLVCHQKWFAFLPEDPPAELGRHQHAHSTPMAGFLPAILVWLTFATLHTGNWLLAGLAIATATGYLDDRGKAKGKPMSWQLKGLGLVAAALCSTMQLRIGYDLALAPCILALIWLFAITNAVNFMDNTDGVAPALGSLGLLCASHGDGPMIFAGACFLAFLPFNWPRPWAFLGDSGSLGLGLCLATASLQFSLHPTGEVNFALLLAPVLIFLIDFLQVITVRLYLGQPPWRGDRRHLTHLLIHLGLPRLCIAPLLAGLAYLGFQCLAN
jgi:UDP-GlcNAc:undecaprenyl-phosphate GlcNAc-1-phosphate transferase